MTFPITFGKLLRQLRKRAGMTQGDLAAAVGYSVSFVCDVEQNRRLPAVAVVLHGGGPGALGLVMASSILARLVGSLFGGVWADRVQPQQILIGSDLVRAATVGAMAIEFTVLTAARTGEVLGATWDEFDIRSALWTIPARRMKSGRVHRVPL